MNGLMLHNLSWWTLFFTLYLLHVCSDQIRGYFWPIRTNLQDLGLSCAPLGVSKSAMAIYSGIMDKGRILRRIWFGFSKPI